MREPRADTSVNKLNRTRGPIAADRRGPEAQDHKALEAFGSQGPRSDRITRASKQSDRPGAKGAEVPQCS